MSSNFLAMRLKSGLVPPRRQRSTPRIEGLPARSTKPFRKALEDLKEASGWGWRDFAEQVSRYGKERTYTFGYLQQVAQGVKPLGPGEAMYLLCEAAAKATGIQPTYFREYREHLAADQAAKLARKIGLDEVLAVLDELKRRSS
jgi:hypothetical protein